MDGTLRNMTSVYITKGNRILLLYRQGGSVVNDIWVGSAGGHFEEYELNDARACVLREMKEELGITEAVFQSMSLRYITLRRTHGEVRQNYYFFAELKEDADIEFSSNEGTVRWFDIDEINALDMPFTAKYVMRHYVETGRNNDKMYGGVADREKVVFTEFPEV